MVTWKESLQMENGSVVHESFLAITPAKQSSQNFKTRSFA